MMKYFEFLNIELLNFLKRMNVKMSFEIISSHNFKADRTFDLGMIHLKSEAQSEI